MKRLLDPVFTLWAPVALLRTDLAVSLLPQPDGQGAVHIAGPDPDRVLLVGGGTAVGYGVLSHDLALAGHLARQVSGLTERGVELDIVADANLSIQSLPAALEGVNLEQYDAVVLTLGVIDTLRRTSARRWRRTLSSVVVDIADRAPSGTHVFVVGVQSARTVTTLDNIVGLLAETHGRMLDHESIRVCAESGCATFVPFAPESEPGERYRSSETYAKWAKQVSPAVAEVLQSNHPLGDFTI